MHDCGYELHLLCHTFRERFDFLASPFGEPETLQPFVHRCSCGMAIHSAQPSNIQYMVGNLHFAIQPTLLGQITDIGNVAGTQRVPIKDYLTAVGTSNHVKNAYQRGLSCTIRAEKPENTTARHTYRHAVESKMPIILLNDILDFDKIHLIASIMVKNCRKYKKLF